MRHQNDFFFFLTEWSFCKVQRRRQQILHGHTGATDQWWPQMKVTSKGVKCTIGPWAAQWQGRPSSHQVFGYTSAFKMKCYWMIKQVYNRWTNRFHVKILLLECKPFICAWKLRYRNGLFLTSCVSTNDRSCFKSQNQDNRTAHFYISELQEFVISPFPRQTGARNTKHYRGHGLCY